MAELVLALASSHSPMLNNSAEEHLLHGERDQTHRTLLDTRGRPTSYQDLLAKADPAIARLLDPQAMAARVERCRRNIDQNRGHAQTAGGQHDDEEKRQGPRHERVRHRTIRAEHSR